jgi:hypothetical protein
MTSHSTHHLVEGEPLELLAEALLHIDLQEQQDGTWSVTSLLEPDVGDPFVRALMRVEARLLLEDADRVGTPGVEHRTYEQRAADALVLLVTSVADEAGEGADKKRCP